MEKVNLLQKKSRKENVLFNEYSYLNSNREAQDRINCLSLDLERLVKKRNVLPSISTERKNVISGIAQKLKKLKKKLKQNQLHQQQIIQPSYMRMPMPLPIPFPIQQQFPPYPLYPPIQNGCCHHQCSHNHGNNPGKKKNRRKAKKQTKQKNEGKINKRKKGNRFRIYVYVVYFCIFFKCYSNKFTLNRRNWFQDRYGRKDGGIIYVASQKILKKLQQIDLYDLSQNAKTGSNPNQQSNVPINWQQYTKTALIPKNTSYKPEKVRQSVSQYIINFTQLLFQKINEIFLDQQFIAEYHQVFSAGSLDLNFLINNLYLPQQAPFLFIHPTKGYLRLSQSEQIQLLLIKIMIKVIIYNYLLGLDKSKNWNKKIQNAHSLSETQMQDLHETIRTVSIYLYGICKEMYLLGIKNLNHISNFNQISKKFGIKKAKHLQETASLNLLDGQQKKQYKFELIRNIKDINQIQQKLVKNNRLNQNKQVIKQRIIDLLSNVYTKIKKQQKDFYNYITNMTLSTPYLIFDSLKQNKQNVQKQQKYRVLKPSQNQHGKAWEKIYAQHSKNSQHSNDKSRDRSKLNVQFQSSSLKNERKTFNPSQTIQASNRKTKINADKQNFTRQNSFDSQQNKNYAKKTQQNENQMYNFDLNQRYDANRQDRLLQRFKNFLNK